MRAVKENGKRVVWSIDPMHGNTLKAGDVGCALIPVENSTIGRVEPAATLVEGAQFRFDLGVFRKVRAFG